MKRIFLCLLTCVSVLSSLAQTQTETTLYVYRNDGGFNAFFFSEIDSITFSSIDLDSVEQADIVVQEFWTTDSVCRVPLAAIDSIGFTTPQTIINSEVFPLTADHIPYIVKGDTLSFIMLTSTPKELLPQKGNVVASYAECTKFVNGIIARVKTIEETNDGYLYICEKASWDDIYDQIVFYGDAVGGIEGSGDSSNHASRRVTAEGELWNISFDRSWEYSGTTTTVSASDRAYCRLTLMKTLGQPLYAKFSINNDINSSVNFNAKSEANISPQPVQIGKTIKAGRITFPHPWLRFIWIEPQISLYGYFEELGSVELNCAAHFYRFDEAALVYSDGKWEMEYNAQNDFGIDVASLSMDGSAEIGLMPEILFSLNGSPTGIGINSKFGIKQTADFKFDALSFFDTGIYDALKDSKTDTYLTQSVSIFAQAGLFKEQSKRGELNLRRTENLLLTRYLLPTFEERYQRNSNTTNEIYITVKREPIIPVYLDMAVYDENDNLVQRSHDNDMYDGKSHNFLYSFTDLPKDRKCKAYPLVKFGNIEMRATPVIDINNCPGEIIKVECSNVEYIRDAEYPNYMYFTIDAILDETSGIEEWGLYHVSSNSQILEFPFESVSLQQTKELLYTLGENGNDESYIIDYSSFIFERSDKLGVYVKKYDDNTGKQRTIYGSLFDYTLRYDTKPSITLSNPYITSTEIIDTQVITDNNGNKEIINQYETFCSYTGSIKGVFWMDYVISGISGGTWHFLDDNSPWYPKSNHEYEGTWRMVYWDNSNLGHSCWKIIHVRNSSQTIYSTILNFFGNGTITNVWTSSSPAFAPKRAELPLSTEPIMKNYVEAMAPIEDRDQIVKTPKKKVPCNGGFLGVF